jgi:phytoene desaturase
MSNQRRTVHIIGAGPGGLATALLLARSGADVHVFERHNRVGGRTATYEKDGFAWDVGATFFMYPRILEEIFSSVGRNLREEIPMVRLDPHYRLVFGRGGELTATPNVEELKRQIASYAPEDAANVDRFLSENREKLASFRPVLEKPFLSFRDFLDPSLLKCLPLLRPATSVDGDLRRYFKDERTRLAFSFQTKYLGMSPFRCPSLVTILSYLEYEYGIFHPIGGCGAISKAMARVAQELGVHVHLNEEVQGIDFEGRRATAVRTPSGTHRCDSLVINSDFARTMKKLVPNQLRRRWSDQKLEKKRFSCSTFMLYLGLRGPCPGLQHHNIFISSDYEGNLDEIERSHVLPENPSFYVQHPGVSDSTLAPEGHSAIYVLVPVSHQHENIDWAAEKQRFTDLILDRLHLLGIENVRDRIISLTAVTPDDWAQDQQIHLGATFNLAHNFGQMLYWRPHNRFEDLEGVYLVGGGTHPGSGLPVIFESARISSDLISRDLGLAPRQQRRQPAPESEEPEAEPVMIS